MKVSKPYFIYTSVDHHHYTVAGPGEYLVMDRHFNCAAMTESQMDHHIAADYRRFKRAEANKITSTMKVKNDEP